jgi:hypothetical protein
LRTDGAGAAGVVLTQISVSNISISKRAKEKILKDRDSQSALLGKSLVPCLNNYSRSYSTLNDGRMIEHGPGFFLSFIEQSEASDDQYLSIDLETRLNPGSPTELDFCDFSGV